MGRLHQEKKSNHRYASTTELHSLPDGGGVLMRQGSGDLNYRNKEERNVFHLFLMTESSTCAHLVALIVDS